MFSLLLDGIQDRRKNTSRLDNNFFFSVLEPNVLSVRYRQFYEYQYGLKIRGNLVPTRLEISLSMLLP